MSSHQPPASDDHTPARGFLGLYRRTPLYVRIMISLALGIVAGELLGHRAQTFKPFSDLVLQMLRLLATPLIFIAVAHALLKADVNGRTAGRLAYLLISNTTVAIIIGLIVVNVIQPGKWAHLHPPTTTISTLPFDPARDLLDKIPANLIDPFQKNEIISIIILAVAFGLAMRIVRKRQQTEGKTAYLDVESALDVGFQLVMVILHWIFDLVPIAVFAVVARTVGTSGIQPILSMGAFVICVLLALALQSTFYLIRLRFSSWVRPGRFLRGGTDALMMAFSTASSAATLPITYGCVKDKMGVREESAGVGVMVGGTFNHDGTALYEAMVALFISQALGMHLGLGQQVIVVFMAIIASVGAAGIPEAGLVTMLAVFAAVHLPAEYIPLLLPMDWFLDRCRTAVTVMGDMTVTCILDGKTPPDAPKAAPIVEKEEELALV
ncbi:dicarboxylate:amino acid:cation symporter DAACS family protein [Capsulimonas corticalis]|uniref:Dicarboxylate:amino acid:cation symporter DAACS family protein n=1 Tax=Capsulimonas corticalis TaxID=2219043 RepID=A0A402CRC7_9BACT|nr:dicarboxylate/amino acid:cation symporter [Capsulimonas corticalis]BDI34507.1 dicarboxylate:amino acid:cation symporter DAACS family protein [Capsulimonas corticalis]